jgi:hypothetical protein
MTPKEKAEELYWKYAEILYLLHDVRALKNSYAKKSALIAVDEILNELPEGSIDYGVSARRRFFEEVKQEIELL